MNLLEEVKAGIEKSKGRLPQVADEADVPYSTLCKLAQGITRNPRIETLLKLHRYFLAKSTEVTP